MRGQVEITLLNRSADPLRRAYVWLLPNRTATRPAGLTDVNYYWFYPRKFSPGSMKLERVVMGTGTTALTLSGSAWRSAPHALAGRNTLVAIDLPRAVAPGESLSLSLDYQGRVPERYGPYGCVRGRCTLVGGFYPMLAAHDRGGWDLSAPPMRGDVKVTVELPRPASVVVFDQWSGNHALRGEGAASSVPYATVFIGPHWYETRRKLAGSDLRLLSARAPPPADDARGQLLPYTQENYGSYALDTAGKAVGLLRDLGLPVSSAQTITLIEAPLRQDLAMAQPGSVIISDRWYRIWPSRRFRKFHDRELVRALGAHLLESRIRSAGHEHERDVSMTADIIGAYLADLFVLKEHKRAEFAGDILQPVSFLPVVDQLLYAPQTMFASSYFGKVIDDEADRVRADRFNHQRPRGRLYYEKLRDLLRPEAMSRFMQSLLEGEVSHRAAAENAYGGSLDWFFRQWTLPYPQINYLLLGKRTVRLADGRFRHEVRVGKRVAAGDHAPVEPVKVLVVLGNGAKRYLRWDGGGASHTLRFESQERMVRIVVDPKGRLVETDLDHANTHALFDNVDDHDLRFVYNSFGTVLNVTDLSALLAADFTLGRVHDTEHQGRFSAWRSASVDAGVFMEYRRSFGPALDPDTLMSRVAVHTSLQRLNADFFAGDAGPVRPATRLSLGTEIRSDDRLFFFEPLSARALAFGLDLTLTRRDAITTAVERIGADVLTSGVASLRYTNVWTPRPGHTLGLNLTAHIAAGAIKDRSQLVTAGGIGGLRGYAPGELFTRTRLMLRTEWRHWYRHDQSLNLGHYSMVRGTGGTLFADLGALSPCDGYGLGNKEVLHGSVGYGLRFAYDSFGTLPFLMRVDVAVPVVRHGGRQCLGGRAEDHPPVMVYVSFEPPF